MSRVQFSMTTLMVVVALSAVSFAALRSMMWASVLIHIFLLIFLFSLIGAIYTTGSRRAFWVGFVLIGSGHWLAGYLPWGAQHDLVSSRFAWYLYPKLQGHMAQSAPAVTPGGLGGPPAMPPNPQPGQVFTVCHSWMTIILAIIGGLVARSVATANAHRPGDGPEVR